MDLPPPLENASEVVRQIKNKKTQAQQAAAQQTTNSTLLEAETKEFVPSLIAKELQPKPTEKQKEKQEEKTVPKKTVKKKDNGGFAGFKSGFLMSGNAKKKPMQAKKSQSSKPEVIKPKEKKPDNPLIMKDVQEAMNEEFQSEEFLNSYSKSRSVKRENDALSFFR